MNFKVTRMNQIRRELEIDKSFQLTEGVLVKSILYIQYIHYIYIYIYIYIYSHININIH